jgi:hypothetical protein
MPDELVDEDIELSRQALARLVLCDEAARVADYAIGLVSTRNDVDTGNGGRASQTAQLVAMAETALVAAVVYERERGVTWAEIGSYLGMTSDDTERRFAGGIAAWEQALEATARHPGRSSHWALADPIAAGKYLDSWAFHRINVTKDRHEVTGSLLGRPLPGEPGWTPVGVVEQGRGVVPDAGGNGLLRRVRAAFRSISGRPTRSQDR